MDEGQTVAMHSQQGVGYTTATTQSYEIRMCLLALSSAVGEGAGKMVGYGAGDSRDSKQNDRGGAVGGITAAEGASHRSCCCYCKTAVVGALLAWPCKHGLWRDCGRGRGQGQMAGERRQRGGHAYLGGVTLSSFSSVTMDPYLILSSTLSTLFCSPIAPPQPLHDLAAVHPIVSFAVAV